MPANAPSDSYELAAWCFGALNEYLDWPGVAQVGQVESEVTRDGQMTREVRSFITSAPRSEAAAGTLLKWARGHWSIENRSH